MYPHDERAPKRLKITQLLLEPGIYLDHSYLPSVFREAYTSIDVTSFTESMAEDDLTVFKMLIELGGNEKCLFKEQFYSDIHRLRIAFVRDIVRKIISA